MADISTSRVLYIEDSADNARLMTLVFTAFRPDLSFDVATSGEAGLRMLESSPPQLVLLDHQLPDTTGLALLEKIRTSGHHMPVFVVTADARWQLAFAVAAAGGNGTLVKPFDISDVGDLLDEAMPRPTERQRALSCSGSVRTHRFSEASSSSIRNGLVG